MKYCKKCVMPDTRPGITFNEEGICSACQAYEYKKKTDWGMRWKEFEVLCSRYRKKSGGGMTVQLLYQEAKIPTIRYI